MGISGSPAKHVIQPMALVWLGLSFFEGLKRGWPGNFLCREIGRRYREKEKEKDDEIENGMELSF